MSVEIHERVPAEVTPVALDAVAAQRRPRVLRRVVEGESWKAKISVGGGRVNTWPTTCHLQVAFDPHNPHILIGTATVSRIGITLYKAFWGLFPFLLLAIVIGFAAGSYVALIGIPVLASAVVIPLAISSGRRHSTEMADRLGRTAMGEIVAACQEGEAR